ncbi:MAG: hypothetical protein GF344_14060 [Chitinivibrionales bacterium]|nr:hypothetical protein [Chitinivibrionales bacterium]MBD3357850.1 hypothetical protein [Chitinivibrionales bacterium]
MKHQTMPLSDTVGGGRLSIAQSGGITGWELGWGRVLGSRLYVGVTYQRIYLNMDSTFTREVTSVVGDTEWDSTHTLFRGNGFRAGILLPLGDFHVGISGSHVFEAPLEKSVGTYRYENNYGSEKTISTVKREKNLKIPSAVSIGLAWQGDSKWLVASDVSVSAWRTYSAGGLLPTVDRDYAPSFSLGAQYIPAPNLLAPKYWETIRYRSGFRAHALPLENNSEYAFSLGTGLPLRGGGLLDLSLEVGRRGDEHLRDLSETFVRFGVGFNGGRMWSRSQDTNY